VTTVAFIAVAGLFLMKILWNLTVPYALAARAFGTKQSRASGISLIPGVEAVLLTVAVLLSLVRGAAWPWNPGGVALIGMAMIIGSYVHLVVAGAIAGWAARRLRGRMGRSRRGNEEKSRDEENGHGL